MWCFYGTPIKKIHTQCWASVFISISSVADSRMRFRLLPLIASLFNLKTCTRDHVTRHRSSQFGESSDINGKFAPSGSSLSLSHTHTLFFEFHDGKTIGKWVYRGAAWVQPARGDRATKPGADWSQHISKLLWQPLCCFLGTVSQRRPSPTPKTITPRRPSARRSSH